MGRRAAPSAQAAAAAPGRGGRKRKGPSFPQPTACKRRLVTSSPAAQVSAWASLPTDLIHLVGGQVLVGDVVDYIAFRAVCSGWPASTPSPRNPTLRYHRLRPREWVALCDGDAVCPDDACEITFFQTRTARSFRLRLPELRRHRILGFTDGLIILLHKCTTAVRVLHPFTRVALDLPPLAPVFHQMVKNRNSMLYMRAAVCASAKSPMTSIAVVVWFPYTPGVLSCEPGRPDWEVIHKDMELLNTLPFKGRLYGFRRLTWHIVQVYPPNPLGPVVAHVPAKFGDPYFFSYNLVDSCGRMLLVVHHFSVRREAKESWQRCSSEIFEVDVRSIGNLALFLCRDRCLAVSAKDLPSISRNSVYYYVLLPKPVVLHTLSDRLFERPTTLCQVHDTTKRDSPICAVIHHC